MAEFKDPILKALSDLQTRTLDLKMDYYHRMVVATKAADYLRERVKVGCPNQGCGYVPDYQENHAPNCWVPIFLREWSGEL